MTKTLFIEVTDARGVREVWNPSDEEMAAIGWIRSEAASQMTSAVFADGQRQVVAMAQGMAAALGMPPSVRLDSDADPEPTRHDVPELEVGKVNGHGVAEAEMQAEPVVVNDPAKASVERASMERFSERVAELAHEKIRECAIGNRRPVFRVEEQLGDHFMLASVIEAIDERDALAQAGKLLSERVAALLRERKCFTFEVGHHPVTQAVLDVLDSHFGKVF